MEIFSRNRQAWLRAVNMVLSEFWKCMIFNGNFLIFKALLRHPPRRSTAGEPYELTLLLPRKKFPSMPLVFIRLWSSIHHSISARVIISKKKPPWCMLFYARCCHNVVEIIAKVHTVAKSGFGCEKFIVCKTGIVPTWKPSLNWHEELKSS